VVLLGRVLNLEGKAASSLMQKRGLARVLVSAGRVDILPPGAKPTGKGGIIAYAWYVFEKRLRRRSRHQVVHACARAALARAGGSAFTGARACTAVRRTRC
jgi:hypothetical protein